MRAICLFNSIEFQFIKELNKKKNKINKIILKERERERRRKKKHLGFCFLLLKFLVFFFVNQNFYSKY
jgi:hypothetical protein